MRTATRALARAGRAIMATMATAMWVLPAMAYADVIQEPLPGESLEPISEATDVSGTLTLVTILVVLVALAAWMTYVIVTTGNADDGAGTDDATGNPDWHDEAQDRMEGIL